MCHPKRRYAGKKKKKVCGAKLLLKENESAASSKQAHLLATSSSRKKGLRPHNILPRTLCWKLVCYTVQSNQNLLGSLRARPISLCKNILPNQSRVQKTTNNITMHSNAKRFAQFPPSLDQSQNLKKIKQTHALQNMSATGEVGSKEDSIQRYSIDVEI